MSKILLGLLGISLMFLTGCATFPTQDISVQVESLPGINFSNYKTYAWLGSAGILRDPEGKWEPPEFDADKEITFLIDRELRNRGLSEASRDPDLVVAYTLGIDMTALRGDIKPGSDISVFENVAQGALVIMLVSRKTGYAVWAGAATADIKNLSPDIAKKRLDYAVTKMLKQLPK